MKTNKVYIKTSDGIEITVEKIDVEQRQPAPIYELGRRDPVGFSGRQEITARIPEIKTQYLIKDQICDQLFDIYIEWENGTNILKNCQLAEYRDLICTQDEVIIQYPKIIIENILTLEKQKGRVIQIDTTSFIEELLRSE